MIVAGRAVPRVARIIPMAIGVAWSLAVVAQLTGSGALLHHDRLIEGGPPLWVALLLFLVAWQAMIAAMMLPSSLPVIRLFSTLSLSQSRPDVVVGAFLAGYAAVWTGFGAFAFLVDVGVHHTVDAVPWLGARPWLISGGVLILAGVFQVSPLKERCLDACRHPGAYLMSRYRRGTGAAFRTGWGHGLFCLGCCWALMLVSFAAGMANLGWMVALTAAMVYEKTGRNGHRLTRPLAVALVVLGALVISHPLATPAVFGTET